MNEVVTDQIFRFDGGGGDGKTVGPSEYQRPNTNSLSTFAYQS